MIDKNTEQEVGTEREASDLDVIVMPDYYPEHNTESADCWCEPEIEIINGTKIIIHRGKH